MKRVMMMAALLVASVSCVSGGGDSAVRLLHARTLKSEGAGCSIGELAITGGELDVSGGRGYVLGVDVESNAVDRNVVIGGVDYSSPGHNDIILTEVLLSYEAQPALPGLPTEERMPIYRVVRAGENDTSSVLFNAFGPLALQQLLGSVFPGQPPVTVLVTVKLAGEMGNKTPVESNEISFPIVVYNSGYDASSQTCASGTRTDLAHPCGYLGQDHGPICRP